MNLKQKKPQMTKEEFYYTNWIDKMKKLQKEMELENERYCIKQPPRYERMEFDPKQLLGIQEITPPTGKIFPLGGKFEDGPKGSSYTTENDPSLGRKFDSGKTDYSLVPLKALEEITDVLGIGARKYAKDNWRYVEDRGNRYWAAAMRHMISWKEGDKLDDETGKNHLAHAICCLMFLLEEDLEK